MSQSDTEEALRERIETLETENERLRDQKQSNPTRRRLLRAAGIAGAGAISLAAATGSASAQSAVFPVDTDPALDKLRADIINYQSVSSGNVPGNGSTSEVLVFVLDGDLP